MISAAPILDSSKVSKDDLHPMLRRYVDDLDRTLSAGFPAEERRVLVDEAIFVLDLLVNEKLVLGATVEEAVSYALATFGSQTGIANAHLEGKFESKPSSPLIQYIGRANAIALGYLGIGTLLTMILLQIRIYMPGGDALRMPFTPAQVRSVLPDPLPFPQTSPLFYLTLACAVVLPFVLGWMIGRQVPVRAGSAVYRSLSPLILASFLFGCGLLPNTEGLLFAIWQLIFWLPVAALCAYLSSTLVRNAVPRPKF